MDEVVPDALWKLDEAFLSAMRIDYVAIEEGVSCDPAYEKERVKGYDLVKSLRKAIPTRRTLGLSRAQPPPVQLHPPEVEAIDAPQEPAANGTIRRMPSPRVEPKAATNVESPFEVPLVDLFD